MIEQWIRWEPIAGISGEFNIESILFDYNGLTALLSNTHNQNKKIKVQFRIFVNSFRKINGNLKIAMMENLFKQHGKKIFNEWTFFKVLNSNYTQLLMEDTLNLYPAEWFNHIAIITPNSILEMAIDHDPSVTFINESSV